MGSEQVRVRRMALLPFRKEHSGERWANQACAAMTHVLTYKHADGRIHALTHAFKLLTPACLERSRESEWGEGGEGKKPILHII